MDTPHSGPEASLRGPMSAAPFRTYRVLVVDDDADMLLLIGSALRHASDFASEVYVANDPTRALEKASKEPFDLVVADYQMPGMSGLDLLGQFRRLHPRTLRVLMTAHSSEQLALDAVRSASVHSYLEKPFHPKTLVAVLQEVVLRQDPLSVASQLGTDESEVALRLLHDLRERLSEVPQGLAELTLSLSFASPVELNGFVSQLPVEEMVKSLDVRYARGRFIVHVSFRGEDGSSFRGAT